MGKEAIEKERELVTKQEREARTLSTGVEAYINPVAPSLVEDVMNAVPKPKVPLVMTEKGREEPNPHDPEYQDELQEYERERESAGMDALVTFGLELADGLPEDDGWIGKLKLLERRTRLDLSEYDLDDDLERRFVYKRYVACGTQDILAIGRLAGLTQQDLEEATETFPGVETR